MKKYPVFCLAIPLWTLFIMTGDIGAQSRFSMSFKGGYSLYNLGELNSVIDSHETLLKDLTAVLGLTKKGSLEEIKSGFDLEGEFMVNLTQRIGIGLGIGILQGQKDSLTTLSLDPLFQLETNLALKMTAVPVKLNAYYRFPVLPNLNIYLNGGFGFYFAKMTYSMDMDESIMNFESSSRVDGNTKDTSIGYHGGVGFEYTLTKSIGILLEASGRYVKFDEWTGNEKYSDSEWTIEDRSGSLWSYEAYDPDLKKYYSDLILSDAQPAGQDIQNVKKFVASLSGFSLRVGLRVRF